MGALRANATLCGTQESRRASSGISRRSRKSRKTKDLCDVLVVEAAGIESGTAKCHTVTGRDNRGQARPKPCPVKALRKGRRTDVDRTGRRQHFLDNAEAQFGRQTADKLLPR